MPGRLAALFSLSFVLLAAAHLATAEDLAAVLQRQTQQMLDAVATGDSSVWDKYLDADVLFTDEQGAVMSKSEVVRDIKGLPPGVSGTIKIVGFKVAEKGPVAITSHLDDEHENYHGHELHCQYRTTDTWLKTREQWKLISSQVLALRTDPPSTPLTEQQMQEYVGRYSLTPAITYEIRNQGGVLEGQRSGGKAEPLKAEVADMLFVPGKPRVRKVFLRGPDGRILGFVDRREAWDLLWKRVP